MPTAVYKTPLPMVGVLVPTYNRSFLLPIVYRQFKMQLYPQQCMKLIIMDDSDHAEESKFNFMKLVEEDGVSNVHYITIGEKRPVGAKRNAIMDEAMKLDCDIMVFWDDDDLQSRQRVYQSVNMLHRMHPLYGRVHIVGIDQVSICFLNGDAKGKIVRTFPKHECHATAGTMAFTRQYAESHRFDETVQHGEEAAFTSGFTEPLNQLYPEQTMLCIAHGKNTFNKTIFSLSGMAHPVKKSVWQYFRTKHHKPNKQDREIYHDLFAALEKHCP